MISTTIVTILKIKTNEKYNGFYAQDEMGYNDDEIDTIFDGNPDAYWNIELNNKSRQLSTFVSVLACGYFYGLKLINKSLNQISPSWLSLDSLSSSFQFNPFF